MSQPYWSNLHIQYDAPPVWIENAYELLDSEGEWYLDHSSGSLYYKPKKGNDMKSINIVIPRLEVLVSGSNVSNIQFKGITFSHATWLSPNTSSGFACLQADVRCKADQMPGNIIFEHSSNVRFEHNVFKNLGATALQLIIGCKNNVIIDNIFMDISGSAISVGGVTDKTPSEEDLVKDNIVINNLITKVALEYEGCVGIFVGYTEHTTITHNELRNLPYSGISVGWGWSNTIVSGKNNEISYNLIDSVVMILKDGGGIYTLSSQPGANVHHNFINHQFHEQGALYPDEGSSNIQWHHNVITNGNYWLFMWTESIQNNRVESNYYDTQKQLVKGANCVIQNNFFIHSDRLPTKAKKIVKSAGREVIYK